MKRIYMETIKDNHVKSTVHKLITTVAFLKNCMVNKQNHNIQK